MNQHRTKQIAKSLMLLAQIPSDDSLVPILGCGNENSNFEALCYWVEQQDKFLPKQDAGFHLEQLLVRLTNKFDEIKSVVTY